jgi:putative methyltransferase (TIGR04325 family)
VTNVNERTRHDLSLLDERDHTALGATVTPPYFFGVYADFQHTANNPFATAGWIDHCQAMIDSWNSPSTKAKLLLRRFLGKRIPIPKHLTMVCERVRELTRSKKTVTVIDVGGGFGDNYHYLEQALGRLVARVRYTVVDNEIQCEFGRKYFKGRGIDFVSNLPESRFDIAVIIGTLQYVPAWKGLVATMSRMTDDSIFVSRTPISLDGPTFVTMQSICPAFGSQALRKLGESNAWVIEETELDECFDDHGFRRQRSVFSVDYSSNFTRLPVRHRRIAYVDKHYARNRDDPRSGGAGRVPPSSSGPPHGGQAG